MSATQFLNIEPALKSQFPGLIVLVNHIRGVKVGRVGVELEEFKEQVIEQVKGEYNLETLKDVPIFRAYREFFWRIGLDPTKIRPAAEALIRRILRGKSMPAVNNVVDSYNLASIKTGIALAAFDEECLRGDLVLRYAQKGESFLGIGMRMPKDLQGGEVVISDREKLIAVYPYRDAEQSKITLRTRDMLLLTCGVPGIKEETLINAAKVAIDYITNLCNGQGGF